MGRIYEIAKKSGGSYRAVSLARTLLNREKRVLDNVFLQLTPLCNLKCKMCYARMDLNDVCKSGNDIMGFNEWKFYIDSASEMGVMMLSLTGGECTLHPDFREIYEYAYDKGMELYVLTNLSIVDDELIALWLDRPPSSISFTVYGGSARTYERLCGNGDAYYRVMHNIDRLIHYGFRIHPKYNCVHDNLEDMESVEKLFRDKGLNLVIGDTLMRFGNCEHETIDKEKVEQEEFREKSLKIWCERNGKTMKEGRQMQKLRLEHDCINTPVAPRVLKGIGCSAGRTQCHINWKGMMTPCVSLDSFQIDPRIEGFKESWERIVEWADEVPRIIECECCIFRKRCISCLAYHYNDLGVYGKPSERLCWKRCYPEKAAYEMRELAEKGLLKFEDNKYNR